MGASDPGLDRLRRELVEEIRASEARTLDRLHQELAEQIQASEARTLDRFHQELVEEIRASEARTTQRIDATAAETRRHFDVVGEALRSNIVVVAEGLAVLDEKVERFGGEVREEFIKVDRRFLHLEARVASALKRR